MRTYCIYKSVDLHFKRKLSPLLCTPNQAKTSHCPKTATLLFVGGAYVGPSCLGL